MNLYEILIPTSDNTGLIPKSRHQEWDKKVRNISGGLTILSPAKGQWVNNKEQIIAERMIPVRIGCSEEQILQIVDMTAAFYQQEAVMYWLVSNQVFIKHFSGKTQNQCYHCLEEGYWEDKDCCPVCKSGGHSSPLHIGWKVGNCEACNSVYFANMKKLRDNMLREGYGN